MLTFLRHHPSGPFLSGIWSLGAVMLLTACQADKSSSISALEQRKAEINSELPELAFFSLNSGVSSIGYRSDAQESSDQLLWVEIYFAEPTTLDEIMLVPTIWRDTRGKFQADAFPAAFNITATAAGSSVATTLIDYPDTSELLPRIAPLVIPVHSKETFSHIRIEASQLNRRAINNDYVFQLAEVLAFSKGRNVALRQRVDCSQNSYNEINGAWHPNNLVDGITPFTMNAAKGEKSSSYVSAPLGNVSPRLTIDLGRPTAVNGIRIHSVEQGDTLPQTYPGDYGMPTHFVLEGCKDDAFSNPETLLEVKLNSIYQIGPILEWPIPSRPNHLQHPNHASNQYRHLRLCALSPYIQKDNGRSMSRVGFAEIELLSGTSNVALGKSFQSNFGPAASQLSPASLTDGRNFYGNILPTQQWLRELARRHDLEIELATLTLALDHKYHQQETNIRRLLWTLAALIVGVAFLLLYERLHRTRQETLIRERIAANLHDELGANLHAIGALGELAQDSLDSPEHLSDTVQRIRSLTRRTGTAARDCSNMLQNQALCDDLTLEMNRESSRLLSDLEHKMSITGEEYLPQLRRRTRIDLLLFYKECLINILRHSQATTIETILNIETTPTLLGTRTQLTLRVSDNGIGLDGHTPSALKRRAKLLKGKLEITTPESAETEQGGTQIQLSLNKFKLPFV